MDQVEVLDETARFPRAERLREVVAFYMQDAGLGEREVTIVLLDDASVAEHNWRDRGVEGPTDVLSYPTYEPDGAWFPGVAHLGDVLISLDTAERQAALHGHSTEAEVMVLAAHAITHLTGLDHQDDEEWKPFLEAQARILEIAGEAEHHS